MGKFFLVSLSITFLAQNIFAATCISGRSKVVMNENYTMQVSGLTSKGIQSGLYICTVIAAGPGFLSTQRQIQCVIPNQTGYSILGWMVEGLDINGNQAASVALYSNGVKAFEAPCSKK